MSATTPNASTLSRGDQNPGSTQDQGDEPNSVTLSADESRVFRALVQLALAAEPTDHILQEVRQQLKDGPCTVELKLKEFRKLTDLIAAQVGNLASANDQATANAFLARWRAWDGCRDGGTKIIVTQ